MDDDDVERLVEVLACVGPDSESVAQLVVEGVKRYYAEAGRDDSAVRSRWVPCLQAVERRSRGALHFPKVLDKDDDDE